ncbi:hypothetical protein Dimus_003784, partial [Dionaea muscipula]
MEQMASPESTKHGHLCEVRKQFWKHFVSKALPKHIGNIKDIAIVEPAFLLVVYLVFVFMADIAIAEPTFYTSLGPQWLQPSLYGKLFSNFTFGCGKILSPTRKFFQEPLKLNFPGHCKRSHGKPLTKAVISREARSP